MKKLETKFTVRNNYNSNENVIVDFEIRNKTGNDLFVLPWNTPLEGIVSDCIKIIGKRNDKIEYDGIMIKRGEPTPEDFILIKNGESKRREINLSEAYDLSSQDEYTLEFNPENLVILPSSTNINEGFIALEKSISTFDTVSNKVTAFKVNESAGNKLTIGQLNRIDSKKKGNELIESISVAGVAKEPKFDGGTEDQKNKVKLAHSNGYSYTQKSINKLADDTSYETWFGEHTADRFNKVKSTYTKVKSRMENTAFTYNLKGEGCRSGTYAYTTKGGSTVWLCDLFWSASDLGVDSKAGTIVHEHSHASADTDDIAYGQTKAKQLAKDDPDRATKNADNFEYYAENETTI
jgi:hypothetical protein